MSKPQHAQSASHSTLQHRPKKRLQKKRGFTDADRDQFFTLSLDMLCIASSDGYFKWLNPAFTQTLGWTVDELLARSYVEFVHPDDLDATLREVERQIAAGEKVFHFENRYRHKDGSWRVLSWKSVPRGELMYAVARDVTEQNRLERELQDTNVELEDRVRARTAELDRERLFLATVLDSIQSGVYAAGADGRVTLVNRALKQMFAQVHSGLTREQVGTLNDIYAEDGKTRLTPNDTPLGRALRGEASRDVKLLVFPKDGPTRTINVNAQPMLDSAGNRLGAVASVEDITERKRLEDQLRQAQKMEAIGQLTGGIAHDFNNLLGVVVGNLDELMEQFDEGSPNAKALSRALKGALHGAELTHRLLAFARRQPLDPKAFAIDEMLPDVVAILHRTLGDAISVQVTASDDLWPVFADPSQVKDALVNLAINARDAMPNGGVLIIEIANVHLDEHYASQNAEAKPGDYAMLAVTDTGMGMSPEVMEHALEPFFTTKPAGKGTGLGLAMIYGFAKQSGGHLKIYSEVGHGTTVKLYLPRTQIAVATTGPAHPDRLELPRGTETVLIAEDNDDLRQVAVEQLSKLGYRVVEAKNGEAALAILMGSDPIDLVFTDVIMSGRITGHDLAREARGYHPGIQILLTTGYAEKAVTNGTDGAHFLRKPYRRRDLALKVRSILDQR